MDKKDFKQLIEDTFEHIKDLTDTKGEEYSRSDDQLANFKRSASEAGILPMQVWLVFYNKHADAIKDHIRRLSDCLSPRSSEPIESRIDDAILYLILLKAMLRE